MPTLSKEDLAAITKSVVSELSARQDSEILKADEEDAELMKAAEDAEGLLLGDITEEQAELYKAMEPEDQLDVLMAYAEDPDSIVGDFEEADYVIAKAAEEDALEDGYDIDEGIHPADMTDEEKAAAFDAMVAGADAEEGAEEVQKAIDDGDDALHKRIEELEAQVSFGELAKVAEERFPNLPGEDSEKVALLMAVQQMDPKSQELMMKVLENSNDAMDYYYKEQGTDTSAGDIGKSSTDVLWKSAQELADKESIPVSQAYMKVLQSPQGSQLYKSARAEHDAGAVH